MFTFTALLGAQTCSPAVQSLLELDGGVKVLVDIGWDETFDVEKLKELERQAPTISIILLTHATVSHLGAYAHCCKNIPFFTRIPVYATAPVIAMGRALLQDLYNSTSLASSFLPRSSLADPSYAAGNDVDADVEGYTRILLPPPSNEEINGFFSTINPLKYSQSHQPIPSPLSPPLEGLTITAYCAGHSLGGSLWHIQHGSESIVYAVDWNQARENVFPGAAWLTSSGATGTDVIEPLRRPTALVCSSKGGSRVSPSGGRAQRDEQLLEHIRSTVKTGGNVLIPCDSSARMLELAYVLERAWASASGLANDPLEHAKLCLASTTCSTTMRYAKSMLEWMDETIVREFEARASQAQQKTTQGQDKGGTPFDFKYLKLVERKSQLTRFLENKGPKVFLASDSSLEWGFAKDLLRDVASKANNLILLVDNIDIDGRSHAVQKSTIHALWKLFSSRGKATGDTSAHQCNSEAVPVKEVTTSPLGGNDLSIYQQYLARQRQRQNALQNDNTSLLESSADAVDDASSSSSSSAEDSDPEHQGKALNVSTTMNHSKHKLGLTDEELGINILLRRKNVHDFDVRGKKGRERMFPYVAKRRRLDDFGDLIRPEDYLRAEERDNVVSGNEQRPTVDKVTSDLGQKRKWGDRDQGDGDGKRHPWNGQNKRRRSSTGMPKESHQEGNAQPAANRFASDDESDESDYEPAEPTVRGPMHAEMTTETIQVKMKIAAVDYSGLHDERSLRMLIPLIRPRKLILTGGDEQETLELATECRRMLSASDLKSAKADASDIMTPTIGEVIDASVDTNAWTIKLSRNLLRRLQWQHVRGLEIVTVNGSLEAAPAPDPQPSTPEESQKKRQKLLESSDSKTTGDDEGRLKQEAMETEKGLLSVSSRIAQEPPILNDVPANVIGGAGRTTNQALHVGDLRLAELRKIMQANGHTAEFKGEGTLLVDGLIAVRKNGVGKIEIESGGLGSLAVTTQQQQQRQHQLGASFSNVKKKVYEGLAVVAAR